jgi:predicted RND superfamily exporter protein
MSRTMTIILSIFIALIAPLSATGLLYYGKIDLKKYAIASTFFFLIALIVGVAYATP